jgi:hypothetical protein
MSIYFFYLSTPKIITKNCSIFLYSNAVAAMGKKFAKMFPRYPVHCKEKLIYVLLEKNCSPQSQFPHSCFCERFIYSQPTIGLPIFLQQNGQPIRGNNLGIGRAVGIFVSNFRYTVSAVYIECIFYNFCEHQTNLFQWLSQKNPYNHH